jgi:hypothetical protein
MAYELTGRGFEPWDQLVSWAVRNVVEGDLIIVPPIPGAPDKSERQFVEVPQETASVLAPMMGADLPTLERWVRAHDAIDGYHISPENDLDRILGAFIVQHEFFPDRRLHLRGISGEHAWQLVGALAARSQGPISVETSAHLAGVTAGIYYRPNGVRALARILKGTELDSIPCDCPVCVEMLEFGGLSEKVPPRTVPIMLHNLYQLMRYVRIYEDIEPVLVQVRAEAQARLGYFEGQFAPEVLRCLAGYDLYLERGWDRVRDQSLRAMGQLDVNQRQLFDVPPTPPPAPCAVCGESEGRFPLSTFLGEALVCEDCHRFYEEAQKVMAK